MQISSVTNNKLNNLLEVLFANSFNNCNHFQLRGLLSLLLHKKHCAKNSVDLQLAYQFYNVKMDYSMDINQTENEIASVAVCGAGAMGRGIALASLLAGYKTVLFDVQPSALSKASEFLTVQLQKNIEKGRLTTQSAADVQARFTLTERMTELAICDVIIEAIIEETQAKEELFSALETIGLKHAAIIASNTSSFSISMLGKERKSRGNFIGLHFFNPPHIMKLTEVVRGAYTDDGTVMKITSFARSLGKTPVVVRDVPGFIVNRTARNFYNEAMRIVAEGAATIEQTDRIMKSLGFKMGPFELMDVIGNDVNLEVSKSIWKQYFYEPRFAPSTMQQDTVSAGKLGRKTGNGFYKYSTDGR